jgi:hypothetical protein
MNPIEEAYAKLTDDWQPLKKLMLHPRAGSLGFADLVIQGRAELMHEPVIRFGFNCGLRSLYRRKQNYPTPAITS